MFRAAALACLLLPLLPADATQAADSVTLYHCTDAQGRLSIRDTPCPKGQQQDTRSMLRPQDPPPGRARSAAVAAPAPSSSTAPPQVIVVNTPRPLYECVRPDGSRYTSESAEGDPRWVPLWTLGFPVISRGSYAGSAEGIRLTRANNGLSAAPRSGLSIPPPHERPMPSPPRFEHRPQRPRHHDLGYGTGTWVRDACHALPQGEVCARLVDQRDRIRTRFFNAQQRERDALRIEERGINARLASDCGIG